MYNYDKEKRYLECLSEIYNNTLVRSRPLNLNLVKAKTDSKSSSIIYCNLKTLEVSSVILWKDVYKGVKAGAISSKDIRIVQGDKSLEKVIMSMGVYGEFVEMLTEYIHGCERELVKRRLQS